MTTVPYNAGELLREELERGNLVYVTLTLSPKADQHDIQALLCTLENDPTVRRAQVIVVNTNDL